MADSLEILEDSSADSELKDLAQMELDENKKKIETLSDELKT